MKLISRLFRRAVPEIDDAPWRNAVAGMPFLQRLTGEELARLKNLSAHFLASHTITGGGDFEVSDDVALAIAAQACLPVLNLTLSLYDDMAGVIVYPAAFVVRHSEVDAAGVVHEWEAPMAGEALDAGGAVVLSWADAQEDHLWDDGGNLVIHEFVHKIDMNSGSANGCPPFLAQFHREIDPALWQDVFSAAYADFLVRVNGLEGRLPANFDEDSENHVDLYAALAQDLPMDPYGAEAPAEFFAVASETFFARPAPLAHAYPQVFELLEKYYRQQVLVLG